MLLAAGCTMSAERNYVRKAVKLMDRHALFAQGSAWEEARSEAMAAELSPRGQFSNLFPLLSPSFILCALPDCQSVQMTDWMARGGTLQLTERLSVTKFTSTSVEPSLRSSTA